MWAVDLVIMLIDWSPFEKKGGRNLVLHLDLFTDLNAIPLKEASLLWRETNSFFGFSSLL